MKGITEYLSTPLFYILIVWTMYWKGRALWKAARKTRKIWFIAILILNTMGLLEIAYLFLFDKDKKE